MSDVRVLITGASRGLGYFLVRAFKERGYWVAGTSRHATDSARLLDQAVLCDLRRADDLQSLCSLDVDILVNNAGVLMDDSRADHRFADVIGTSIETLRETYEVNYFAPFVLSTRHAERMIHRGWGRIANVTSGMGRLAEISNGSYAYRSSKLSTNGLTIALSALRANCPEFSAFAFCPGWLRTNMGGALATGEPMRAAAELVRLCELPSVQTNGAFLRGDRRLSWFSKAMEAGE